MGAVQCPAGSWGVWCELFRRRKQQERARSLELHAAYFKESEQLLKWLPNNPLAAKNKWP